MQKQEGQELFKQIMGNYPTGVTIVTTMGKDGIPVGLTVNSFASVSLDPLMLLWSIDHRSSSLGAFEECDKFAVHVLSSGQKNLCKTFASKISNRFSTCEWGFSEHGLPIIAGALGVFECRTFKAIEAGDHTIFVGEVIDLMTEQKKNPMLYHRRKFGSIPEEFYKQEQLTC